MNPVPVLILRPFLARDQKAAEALVLKGLEEHWGVLDPSLNPDLKEIGRSYANGAFLLAYWQGCLAGTGAFLPHGPEAVQIVRMSVRSEYRRLGLGRAILRQLARLARQRGMKKLVLETTETWLDATSFYARCGFVTTHYADGDRYFELDLAQTAALDAPFPFECYTLRLGRPTDALPLQEVERKAAFLFKDIPGLGDIMSGVTPEADYCAAAAGGRLWVAETDQEKQIGFALMKELDGAAHLAELDVVPECGQRGLGKIFIDTVCAWAAQQGYPAVTLTTQRDVAWNMPFYARQGFQEVPNALLSAAARQVLAHEAEMGLPPERRVWMRRQI